MTLDDKQVTELAGAFKHMVNSLGEFFSDPQNKKKYNEWHLKKYGFLPKEMEATS